jgi:uncharacterized protein YegL
MNLPNPFPGVLVNSLTNHVVTTTNPNPPIKFKRAGTAGTLIVMVLDESGSMASCAQPTIAGFNEFLQGQRSAGASAGDATLLFVKFDGARVKTVCENTHIDAVPPLTNKTYTPSGGTNLLDAIGTTMERVNRILAGKKKSQRPGVIFTIMTDGQENSSTHYTNGDIQNMVKSAEKSDWTFQFLGANIDAFAVGSTFGMNASNSVNYSTSNMAATMSAVSSSTVRVRAAKMSGLDTQSIYNSGLYTDQELKNMNQGD